LTPISFTTLGQRAVLAANQSDQIRGRAARRRDTVVGKF